MTVLDAGLLLLGVIAGGTIAAHGAQKAFGWWGGPGMARWTRTIADMGFHPAPFFAYAAMVAELAGGLALALGFLTPVAAAIVVAQSVVIIFHVHWRQGFWNSGRGIEYPMVLAVVAVFLGLVGRGLLSIDGLLTSFAVALHGGLEGTLRLTVAPLPVRIALLLAGAIAGSIALAVPHLVERDGPTDRIGSSGRSR